ncbi:MAG: replication initiation factor domain-containing protein [Bacilli bacterium]|nr:replication initiation factor domain-containing protein [Bacilli bacterium]
MDDDKKVIIDYLSATFPLIITETEDEQERSLQTYRYFRDYFGLHSCQCRHEAYATNNYKYQFTLSEFITLRCSGPINADGERTCQIELKGEGCREFERIANGKTWVDLFNTLIGMDASFKRIDVTLDDYSGLEITQNYLFKKIRNGEYTSVFKSAPNFYGCEDDGLSIELGSRKSPVQLVIYDKRAEQLKKKKKVDQSYWCRYEMRFRQAKADVVVLELCKNYKYPEDEINGLNLPAFAKGELYSILDIKDDNDFNKAHKCMAKTDSKWLSFLENCEKTELPKIVDRPTNYETRRAYAMPKAAVIIGTWYAMCNRDMDLFMHDFLKEMYELFGKFTRNQKKRFNECLIDNGLEPLDEKQFERFKMEFYEKLVDMELPF